MSEEARYVYCVARGQDEGNLGPIGIDAQRVYAVVWRDLCALVHDCPPAPYQADDREVVEAWVLAHHRAVEAAWRRFGTVLPLTFNTIVRPGESEATDALRAWLDTEYESLKGRLAAMAGRAEWGVQLFWDASLVARQVVAASPEIGALEHQLETKPRGLAYMYRQKLESVIKKGVEAWAAAQFRDVYARVSRCADRVQVEKARPGPTGRPMLLHVSCLVEAAHYPAFQAELDQVARTEGLGVRLTGPLPPYSFCQ